MPTQSDLRFTFDLVGSEVRDVFEVVEFEFHEALSETFHLTVELASANPEVDFGQVLDRPARLPLWHGEKPVRYIHGAVSSFSQGETGFRRTRYSAVVEPRLARLKLSSDWRIFQTLTVPQIAELFLSASNVHHGPPAQGTRAQRYAWTAKTHERLERMRLHRMTVRIAATQVVWQTSGFVLGEELFEADLKEANSSGDVSGILAFSHLSSAPRMI